MLSCYHKDAKLRAHSCCLNGALCRYNALKRSVSYPRESADGTWYSAPHSPCYAGFPLTGLFGARGLVA